MALSFFIVILLCTLPASSAPAHTEGGTLILLHPAVVVHYSPPHDAARAAGCGMEQDGGTNVEVIGQQRSSTGTSSSSPLPDASLLRRLYAGQTIARWGARCVRTPSATAPLL
nr:unnamed protein product [Digitaria exilis]